MEIEIEKLNEVYCTIKYADSSQMLELREFTSFYAPNYKYHPKFKAKIWNGKVSYYDARKNLFPIGCLPELKKFCDKFSYTLKISESMIPRHLPISDFDLVKHSMNSVKKGLEPRDYQFTAAKNALNNRRGIVLSATGCMNPNTKILCQITDEDLKFLHENFKPLETK